jgi:hypothetical protein
LLDASNRKRWLPAAVLLGVVYCVIGVAFGAFARWAASSSTRATWNRLAFVAAGIAFTAHIAYEHFRLGNSSRIIASHTSIAVALGAFGLALVANVNDLASVSGYRPKMLIAVVAWPVLTAVPAFIVALIVTAGLRLGRGTT